ncbi:MAG: DUF4251 domain-containing protein [Alistipes sp.]|nr:DUF4251 domain-containing protein [Alistipes sp.]
MKKFIVFSMIALFALAGYEAQAQKQNRNAVPASPRQEKREVREQRRAAKQLEFENYIDSLVRTGRFQFIPRTIQLMPAGALHLITNPNFNMQYWDGTFDVFLPYVKGFSVPYRMTVLNYTISNPEAYLNEQTSEGRTVTFTSSLFSATQYTFTLEVYTKTGSAVLTIKNPWSDTVQYNGNISAL